MSAIVVTSDPAAAVRATRVGMVGAGQLARMTHQAAIGLGVELYVLATSAQDPAVRAGARLVQGDPADLHALRAFAAECDVLTFDHEHVPAEHLATLEAEGITVAPGAGAKRMAQDKLHARRTLGGSGFPVPPFVHARTPAEADGFAQVHGWPLVAKAPRGGYDGRGVWTVPDSTTLEALLAEARDGLLVEPRLAIDAELAVMVARSARGATAIYPVVQTVQRDAMCREILAPAPIDPTLASEAGELAAAIAEAVGAVGVIAVELFVVGGELFVNELALRPHNSGHWTIEGACTSQFEQHLRAVLGWPLGLSALRAPAVVTVNVVGGAGAEDPAANLPDALSVQGAHVHLYGKTPAPGRKLGHVTVCGEDLLAVRADAHRAVAKLEGRVA